MNSARPDPSASSSPGGPLVLDLSGTGTVPLQLVGGKALNLGKLLAAGVPVPRGFCLTTAAYELAEPPGLAALAAELDAPESGADPAGPGPDSGAHSAGAGANAADPGRLAGRARTLITEAPTPHPVDAAVRTAYAQLGGTLPVAVRSSATAEDLPFASFAGQQDSYLDVVGADAVVGAVRRCWASLWSDRAVAYRSANGISNREVRLAVVVQAGRHHPGGAVIPTNGATIRSVAGGRVGCPRVCGSGVPDRI